MEKNKVWRRVFSSPTLHLCLNVPHFPPHPCPTFLIFLTLRQETMKVRCRRKILSKKKNNIQEQNSRHTQQKATKRLSDLHFARNQTTTNNILYRIYRKRAWPFPSKTDTLRVFINTFLQKSWKPACCNMPDFVLLQNSTPRLLLSAYRPSVRGCHLSFSNLPL